MRRRTSARKARITKSMPFVGRRPYIYRVVIELDDDRYHAEIPTLPGCYSWGRTYEEALRNIKEALELWLEAKLEDGESVPLKDPETVRAASYTVGVVL